MDARDVTQTSLSDQIKKYFAFIANFLKHPMQNISKLPNWSWKKTVFINTLISIAAGVLNGLIPPNIYNIAFGLIFMPVISFVTTHILCAFFYYYFQVFEKRSVDFLQLLRMIVLTNIPFLILHCLTTLVPPIALVGMAFSALLLIVGLTDNFSLDKKRAIKLVGMIYAMIFVVWLWEKVDTRRLSRSLSSTTYEIPQ